MRDKIEEIRARHELVGGSGSVIHPTGFSWTIPGWVAHADRATLLAEVDRLRASLKQFRCSCDPGECVEYGERWSSVCEKGEARDVLEGKP